MEYRNLGRTGLRISRLGLGTVNFSWVTDEDDSHAILNHAVEQGINLVDTACNYNAGKTEECIGRWLAQGGSRRESIILASKVYCPPTEWMSTDPVKRMGDWASPDGWGLSARNIIASCEASLKRLQTDRIDLFQMHHIDRSAPWEEIWQAMDKLIADGKVLYIGSSNFAGWHIAKAQESAKRRGTLGLVSEQSVYNLMNRTVELEVLPAARDYGLGVLVWSPLMGGRLAGRPAQDLGDNTLSRRTLPQAPLSPAMETFTELAESLGYTPAEVAFAWVANSPDVTAPLAGPRTVEQLKEDIAALEIKLDTKTMKRLDEIFPGPGGRRRRPIPGEGTIS